MYVCMYVCVYIYIYILVYTIYTLGAQSTLTCSDL